MNAKSITTASRQRDPALEKMIHRRHAEIKERAVHRAKEYARHNHPDADNDRLHVYIDEYKSEYEKLGSDVMHYIQPATQLPEGKMDLELYEERAKKLEEKIKTHEGENYHSGRELSNANLNSVPFRIIMAGVISFIVIIGEVFYNAKSFQVIVENLLFALLLSFAISVIVLVAAHFAAFLYKEVTTKFKRRLVVWGSLSVVTIVFLFIASIRSQYLALHDVHISPLYFIVFNLFFFIVSALVSFFLLPAWPEFKEHLNHIVLKQQIKKQKRKLAKLHQAKDAIESLKNEMLKDRTGIIYQADYARDLIVKMYWETVSVFKGTNHFFRSDRKTPLCFSDPLPEPNIQDIAITIITERK